MTLKILAFLTRHPSLTPAEFRVHYEAHHIPIVQSLTVGDEPLVYKRSYVQHHDELSTSGADLTFDVVTELVFRDRGGFATWLSRLEEGQGVIAEDEKTFLNTLKTRVVVVEECVTRDDYMID